METINRGDEIFKVLKQGLLEYRNERADIAAELDDKAQYEFEKQSRLNSDIGGGYEFGELPQDLQEKLLDEAECEIENALQEVFPGNNDCLNILVKILRGEI